MAAHTARRTVVHRGVRRLNPLRDLGQVASVIQEGFGHDLTAAGQQVLREMRLMSHLKPLLWWLMIASPDFREYHSGFVWVEEGQVVGSLHITRPRLYARQWLISNVAVRSSYRRQGIARTLMEAALDWAQEQGGEAVFLRVRRDNAAAWSLYESLGFEPLYDTVDLRLTQVPVVEKVTAAEISLAPYQSHHWRQVRELARESIPPDLHWLESARAAAFRPSLERRLAEWWASLTTGSQVHRLIAQRNDRVVAAMAVRVGGHRGNHSLTLHVAPDQRGQIEEMLITEALSRLGLHRDQTTFITLPVGYDEILSVLKQYGFWEQRRLVLMRRSLGQANQKG
jgi:GNAT superfamily N-acetyltransferase